MGEPPDPGIRARGWVEKAEHDLTATVHLLTLEDRCRVDVVCFHAHQAAEK